MRSSSFRVLCRMETFLRFWERYSGEFFERFHYSNDAYRQKPEPYFAGSNIRRQSLFGCFVFVFIFLFRRRSTSIHASIHHHLTQSNRRLGFTLCRLQAAGTETKARNSSRLQQRINVRWKNSLSIVRYILLCKWRINSWPAFLPAVLDTRHILFDGQ